MKILLKMSQLINRKFHKQRLIFQMQNWFLAKKVQFKNLIKIRNKFSIKIIKNMIKKYKELIKVSNTYKGLGWVNLMSGLNQLQNLNLSMHRREAGNLLSLNYLTVIRFNLSRKTLFVGEIEFIRIIFVCDRSLNINLISWVFFILETLKMKSKEISWLVILRWWS